MTVKELIKELEKFDWDLEIVYAEEWGCSSDIGSLELMECYMRYQWKEVPKERVKIYTKERSERDLEFKKEWPNSVLEL